MTKDQQQLLQSAANEIRSLREQNKSMGSRLEVFDNLMLLFKTEPSFPRMGMGEDLVYKIEKTLVAENEEAKSVV